MRALCQQLISDARTDIEGSVKTSEQRPSARGLPAGAFVRHLLQADSKVLGRPFTDDEVRHNL